MHSDFIFASQILIADSCSPLFVVVAPVSGAMRTHCMRRTSTLTRKSEHFSAQYSVFRISAWLATLGIFESWWCFCVSAPPWFILNSPLKNLFLQKNSGSLVAMPDLKHLFQQNRAWSENIRKRNPDFFKTLSQQQSPEYLWIGCSDSRVPANEIVGLLPGELFVHRNVANVVVHSDLNCLSVLQYAIDVLKVKHVIVCGHYGCGGVNAALCRCKVGLVDNWLRHVQDVMQKHDRQIQATPEPERLNRLCELNVMEQVVNVGQTTVVQAAWERGQNLSIHGWVYGLKDGLLRDLNVSGSDETEILDRYRHEINSSSPT